jgi:hypothetical protein
MKLSIFSLTIFVQCCFAILRPGTASAQRRPTDQRATTFVPPPSSVLQGTITISANLLQPMEQEWQMSAAQLGANAIQVQLWQVTYQPDPKNNQTTNIIFQQRVNAQVSYQFNGNALGYRVTAVPPYKNLAVVVVCHTLQSASGVMVMGFPNDGRGHSPGHHYTSNIGTYLAGNTKFQAARTSAVAYGIYSVVHGQTNPLTLDFKVTSALPKAGCPNCFDLSDLDPSQLVQDLGQLATTVINGITYIFNQVVDGVSGLAGLAINTVEQGIVQVGGYFINQTGTIFYEVGGALLNFVVYGNTPRMRSLTQAEYDWANSMIFNGSLPPLNTIMVFNFMSPDSHRSYTFPSLDGSNEYLNIGDAFDNPIGYSSPVYPAPGELFIHELTHVWQIGQLGAIGDVTTYFKDGGMGQSYNYQCTAGVNGNFDLEQQGQITNYLYAKLYYPNNLYAWDSYPNCPFEQAWVTANIRKGVLFDTAAIYATVAMKYYGSGMSQFVGNVSNGVAVPSPGNATDKGGYFMGGSQPGSMLYFWSRSRQATANWGPIRARYLALGAERGPLGWPDAVLILGLRNGGSFQQFTGGWIYSTPQFGTWVVTEPIFSEWTKQNWEKGPLGYPISDYIPDPGTNGGTIKTQTGSSGMQKFEHGIITLSERLGRVQTQVIMNNQLINNNLSNATKPAGPGTTQSQVSTNTVSTGKLTPGEKNSLNPQPLPPKLARPNQ